MKANAKRRTLCLLLAAVLLAGGALWAVSYSKEKAAREAAIPLCSVTADTLRQLRLTYGGQTLTLDYQGGAWSLADDPAYHLDTAACDAMLAALSGLEAGRSLNPVPGEDYGLDTPLAEVEVQSGEESFTLIFGAENPVTGDLYLQKSGEAALYTLSAGEADSFLQTKESLFAPYQPAGLTVSDIQSVACTLADGAGYTLRAVSVPASADGEDASSYTTAWQLDGQAAAALDTARVDDLLAALSSYVTGQLTSPDASLLALFEAPEAEVTVQTADGACTLRYARGTDGCYLSVEGDGSVYQIELATLETIAAPASALLAQG